MLKRQEKLVITFYTTTAAMTMEQLCRDRKADGRMIPVPGSVSADCGLAWCAEPGSRDELLALMKDCGISWQGVYICLV